MNVIVVSPVGRVRGKASDGVTPAGSPDKSTVTVPENPFSGVNDSCTCAFVFGEMERDEGLAVTLNEGGLVVCEPPPQPDTVVSERTRAATHPNRALPSLSSLSREQGGLKLGSGCEQSEVSIQNV